MTSFLIPVAAALLVVAVCTGVLVRRDRRRMAGGAWATPDAGRAPTETGCRTGRTDL
ncbi:hypothetical protein [Streptomyces sp. NPDC047061]|uniref:hypothetical protein n=1 Tax=Streptomyces sp. NPDC047061 TaxID=3154605 RepID=UPI0033FEB8FE